VQLSVASYNRDAARFPDPERFDIFRKPGRYLSFGFCPRGCFGAPLAKEEAHISLETLFWWMPE
jgi:cytochrome P450